MTKFEQLLLSKYLIGTKVVEYEKNKSKVFAILISKSLWTEWNRYKGFQSLSLMLKSPVMTKIW